jgi:hypothetical protein
MKMIRQQRLKTTFARHGRYALDIRTVATQAPADCTIGRIGALADRDFPPIINQPANESHATLETT